MLLCTAGEKRQTEGSYLGREPAGPPREGRQPRAPQLGGLQHMKPDHSLLLSSHVEADSYGVPVFLLREAQAAKRNTRTKRVDDLSFYTKQLTQTVGKAFMVANSLEWALRASSGFWQ